ncbi:hypothetical protein Zmor_026750 [Zophobas morio]|uniref:Uncharacterized protein n=1 Tax=Zophobas morio TaxID=2755281 RepID=A0AA38M680_9CUCU|nr:hypothetical protein Zmor_026750 [Zophobas morio]
MQTKNLLSFIQHKKGCSRIPRIMQYKDRVLNTPTEIVNGFSEYSKSVYAPHNNILSNEISIDRNTNFYCCYQEVFQALKQPDWRLTFLEELMLRYDGTTKRNALTSCRCFKVIKSIINF